MQNLLLRLFAEAVGTFCLVFFGTGTAVALSGTDTAMQDFATALAFGMTVLAMILAFGRISGAHINPAITVGFFVARRISFQDSVGYIIAQCTGAFAGSLALEALFSSLPGVQPMVATTTTPSVGIGLAFGIETLITFLLMLVILCVATGAKKSGMLTGFAVGGVVFLCALTFGSVTGASMNPARTLGPALATGTFEDLWLYLTAPLVGAGLALPACRLLTCKSDNPCCEPTQPPRASLDVPIS